MLARDEETEEDLDSLPVEKRVFYKAISGLHASISSHIATHYLLDRNKDVWGLDLDQYNLNLDRALARPGETGANLVFFRRDSMLTPYPQRMYK